MLQDNDMTAAMEWCAKARKLLGLFEKGGGRRHGNRMDEAIKELNIELQLAAKHLGERPDNDRKKELQREYELARNELIEIGKLAKAADDRKSNEMAQVASDRLSVLQYSVATKFFTDEDGSRQKSLKEAEERLRLKVDKYRLRYEERLAAAQKARKSLFVLNQPGQQVPYEKPVVDAISEATGLAQLGAHAEAISVLDGVEGLVKVQLGLVQADSQKRNAAARDKPVYESQRQLIEKGLERIKGLPGTQAQQQALTLALQEAKQLADDPSLKYRAAFEKLQAAEGQIEAGVSASQQFEQGVDGPLKGKYGQATKKLAEFKATFGLGQPDVVSNLTQELQLALSKMNRPQPDKDGAIFTLDQVLFLIQDKTTRLGQGKSGYEQRLGQARQLMKDAEARTQLGTYQPLLSDFRAAGVEYAAQQYASAVEKLDQVILDATHALDAVRVDFEAWGVLLASINTDQFEPLKKAAEQEQAEFKGAGLMLAEFTTARDVLAGQQHDFAKANEVGRRVQQSVGMDEQSGWRKALHDLAALEPKRLEARQALEAARATLQKLRDAGGDVSAFEAQLSQLNLGWDRSSRESLDGVKLDTALLTLKDGLTLLKNSVEEVLSDTDGKLKDSKASATSKEQAAALQSRLSEVKAQLLHLEQETPGNPVTLLVQRLEQARLLPPDQQPAALQAVNQIGQEAQQLLDAFQKDLAKAQNETRQLGQQFIDEAGQLKSKHPELAKACDALLNRVNAVLGLADSSVLSLVLDGKQQLTGYRAIFDPKAQAITAVANKLKALEELLGDAKLGEHLPSRKGLLAARLEKEMPGRCAGDIDKALDPLLTGFEKEINQAISDAAAAALQKGDIALIADRVDKELEKLGEAPSLQKAFKARVAAARKPAEGRELGARQDLEGLEQLIAANLSKPEVLASLEQGAKQAEAAAAQAQASWEAQVEIFRLRELKAATELHSRIAQMLGLSTRNEGLYKQMQQAFEDAQGLAKAGEHVRALDQLGRARRLAQQYADNPDGGKASSTRELKQAVDGWRKTVAEFIGGMNGMEAMVKLRCETDDAYRDNVGALGVALRRVALSFDAGAFDAMVGQLDQSGEDLGKRRSAKEEGLRHLRRFQEVMEQDPVFALLADSPFGIAPVKALKDRARMLELNLKRA